MLDKDDDFDHPFAGAIVTITGVAYFIAWSVSFYPQVVLNYQRKKTTGLSADFVILNPIGHFTLMIWNWGMRLSTLAQRQYRSRHNGHNVQISNSDLAFSLHAFILSFLALVQVVYYAYKNRPRGSKSSLESRQTADNGSSDGEREPLLAGQSIEGAKSKLDIAISSSTIVPSIPAQIGLVAIVVATLVSSGLVWGGKAQFLDWLYFVSTLKLVLTSIKYIPQVLLNYRLKNVEGFSIWVMILDLIGSVLSFTQLVVSSIWIEKDPGGIFANPAKLGLSFLSVFFDLIFIVQAYYLYPSSKKGSLDELIDEEIERVERG